MPTYEYTCLQCDKTINLVLPMEDRENQVCEDCGNKLIRSWTVGSMSVWSPTKNGGMS